MAARTERVQPTPPPHRPNHHHTLLSDSAIFVKESKTLPCFVLTLVMRPTDAANLSRCCHNSHGSRLFICRAMRRGPVNLAHLPRVCVVRAHCCSARRRLHSTRWKVVPRVLLCDFFGRLVGRYMIMPRIKRILFVISWK